MKTVDATRMVDMARGPERDFDNSYKHIRGIVCEMKIWSTIRRNCIRNTISKGLLWTVVFTIRNRKKRIDTFSSP
jgi:hypothetical protein